MSPDSSSSWAAHGVQTLPARPRASVLTRSRVLALTLTVIVAAGVMFRTTALATYGFSDDEVTKLRAVQAYSRGEFAVNAEHPMLMKAAIWGSVRAADGWNRLTPERYHLQLETALRLPNAIVGSAAGAS